LELENIRLGRRFLFANGRSSSNSLHRWNSATTVYSMRPPARPPTELDRLLAGIKRHFPSLQQRRNTVFSTWLNVCSEFRRLIQEGALQPGDPESELSVVTLAFDEYQHAPGPWTASTAPPVITKCLAACDAIAHFESGNSLAAFNKNLFQEFLHKFHDKSRPVSFFKGLAMARAYDLKRANDFQQLGLAMQALEEWFSGRNTLSKSDVWELGEIVVELNFALGVASTALPVDGDPPHIPDGVRERFLAIRLELLRFGDNLTLLGRYIALRRLITTLAADLTDLVLLEWRLQEEQVLAAEKLTDQLN
jgi:hypothetical protein